MNENCEDCGADMGEWGQPFWRKKCHLCWKKTFIKKKNLKKLDEKHNKEKYEKWTRVNSQKESKIGTVL